MIRVVVGVCVVLALPAPALAYCRTMTIKPDSASYDAVERGCWEPEGAVPLFWLNNCIGYSIHRNGSRKISGETVAADVSLAFTRWTGASCPTDGTGRSRPSIDVRYLGLVDCAKAQSKPGVANQNVIYFEDDVWPDDLKGVLGITYVQFLPRTGEILGADMRLNMVDTEPRHDEETLPAPGEYDFLSIVTHEAGHFLGFAHSNKEDATMVADYRVGSSSLRTLAPDDVSLVCEVYRPNGVRAVLGDKITTGGQCDPTPRGGYTKECLERSGVCSAAAPGMSAPGGCSASVAGVLAAAALRRRRKGARIGPWRSTSP